MKRKPTTKPDMVKVMVYSWDSSFDRYLPRSEAKQRFDNGELAIDNASGRYCMLYDQVKYGPNNPPWIPDFLAKAPRTED